MAIKITLVKNNRGNWKFKIPARCCNCGDYHITHTDNLSNFYYLSTRVFEQVIPTQISILIAIFFSFFRWIFRIPPPVIIPPDAQEIYYCQTCFELISYARHLRYFSYLGIIIGVLVSGIVIGTLNDQQLIPPEWVLPLILTLSAINITIAILLYRYFALQHVHHVNPYATHHSSGALSYLRIYFYDFIVFFRKNARFAFSIYVTHPHYVQDLIEQNQSDCKIYYSSNRLKKMQQDYDEKLTRLHLKPHKPSLFSQY